MISPISPLISSPSPPEYLGRRGPELTWQVTIKFHLLNTVSSGQPAAVYGSEYENAFD